MRTVEDVLAHHGVKGQKWGVRHDPGHAGQRATNRKIASLDKKFARRSQAPKTTLAVYNRAAQTYDKNDLHRINNKPQYKNADFTRDSPLRQKYYREHADAMLDNLEKAADEFGTNASGTAKYGIVETPTGGWDIYVKEVKHADVSKKIVLRVQPKFDATGHIIGLSLKDSMAQSSMVDEFLEHHGVKGQKWGIRNKKSRVKTRPSGDARKIAELKKKKPSQLTNKQLKSVQERSSLERSFRQATPSKVEKGHAVAKSILALASTAAAFFALAQSPGGKRVISAGKAFVDVSLKVTSVNKNKIDVSRFQRSAQGTLF